MRERRKAIEWPTLGLIALCYALWLVGLWFAPVVSLPISVLCLAVAIAFHGSLTHEVIHGHPTPWQAVNVALVSLPLSLVVPYARFRDTHLAHHRDANLTDPYDDPESNFWGPGEWSRMSPISRLLLTANNTLLGRIFLGPLIGQVAFLRWDWRSAKEGDRSVVSGWLWHLPAALVVIAIVAASPATALTYALGVYLGLALLKIRTFLEHQAHELSRARSVIIEDRGPLALLFLNNNLHAVHHMHPDLPWYALPRAYAPRRARYLEMNEGYLFRSYGEVMRAFLWRRKDPVAHPLLSQGPDPH